MIDNKGKYRCDAEIGSCKNGWHSCNNLAVIQCERYIANGAIFLEFCELHRNRATEEGRRITKELPPCS